MWYLYQSHGVHLRNSDGDGCATKASSVDEVFKKYPENYTCCKNKCNIQFLKFDDCHGVIKPACRIGKVNSPDDQRM
jgi:hypothetical protein